MTLHLFTARRSCHDVGVCQRTGPQCRRACHMPTPAAEPPIGYEAARPSNVRALRQEYEHNLQAAKAAKAAKADGGPLSEEERDRPADAWAMAHRMLTGALCVGLLLAIIGLIFLSAADPALLLLSLESLHQAAQAVASFFSRLGWAAMHVTA